MSQNKDDQKPQLGIGAKIASGVGVVGLLTTFVANGGVNFLKEVWKSTVFANFAYVR